MLVQASYLHMRNKYAQLRYICLLVVFLLSHNDFKPLFLVNNWCVERLSPGLEGCGPSLIPDSTDESPLLRGFGSKNWADVSFGADGGRDLTIQ